MATAQQRAIATLDALLNTTSSTTQRQRAMDAFGSAANYVHELLDYTKNKVKRFENLAAKEATEAAVDSDFTETP